VVLSNIPCPVSVGRSLPAENEYDSAKQLERVSVTLR
jgi:hypothetical protein